jgi:hypothetical protein
MKMQHSQLSQLIQFTGFCIGVDGAGARAPTAIVDGNIHNARKLMKSRGRSWCCPVCARVDCKENAQLRDAERVLSPIRDARSDRCLDSIASSLTKNWKE